MPTYTVSLTGPGDLMGRFEQMLDVLPGAALEGDESLPVATLWFDVRAPNADAAVERAFLRAQNVLRGAEVTFEVVLSRTVEGRRPWWRELFAR